MLTAFYHVWTPGQWQVPHREFWEAIDRSGFPGGVHENHSDAPSEAPTINEVRKYAQTHDGAVLYAHTKGAWTVEPFRDRWRQSMTNRVVDGWRENVEMLDRVQAVGCHWLTEEMFPGMFGPTLPPFFGGNFWIARCDYLRTLPECVLEPRYEAERWIGLGDPTVHDLLPGWPSDHLWPELL